MNRLAETIPTLKIKRVLRKMRGGSQAHLVEANNGRYYVAKFLANPQGNRSLVNEWVMHRLLRWLDVCTPNICLLELSEQLRQSGQISFSVGTHRLLPQGRLHLGSECPVDPSKHVIFDDVVFPSRFLPLVLNLPDFARAFAADQWLHNADSRQLVFTRDRLARSPAFRGYFIDGSQALGGAHWELHDSKTSGLYMQQNVYSLIDFATESERAIETIESLSATDLEGLVKGIPSEWFAEGDRAQLFQLMNQLDRRRGKLRHLVERHNPLLRSEPAGGAVAALTKFPSKWQPASQYGVLAIA
jgi:hypothetical protein